MNLGIQGQLFLVGGASGGLGKAVLERLLQEGARVIAIARGLAKLQSLKREHPGQVEILAGDITKSEVINQVVDLVGERVLSGILVNAGGPPAMPVLQTTMKDWDQAYQSVFRWKVELIKKLISGLLSNNYGRIVFIESMTVKQPLENMVLSNSLRLAVVGFVKTLSQEIGDQGVTLNILGPGYHHTTRIDELLKKNSQLKGISKEEVKKGFEKQIKVGYMGKTEDFGSLAVWFLSPVSGYITGQTISVDGGVILGTMG